MYFEHVSWFLVLNAGGCTRQPIYNLGHETRGIYCSQHKLAGMVNVRSGKCNEDGCTIRPNFNHQGVRGGVYCNTHKKEGMVNVNVKRCKVEGNSSTQKKTRTH